MVLEIVAIAVIELGEIDVLRCGEPAAIFVIDEHAANAPQGRFAKVHRALNARQCARASSIRFQLIGDANDEIVGHLQSVLGMLCEGLGEIGNVDFGNVQGGLSR
jgi:hypothetical protein